VITDKKIPYDDGTRWKYYTADVVSTQDYYAFGQGIEERGFSRGTYRYGMNGQEKDNDIAEGIYTAEFWEYDSRICRRWNVDPKPNLSESLYACFGNNPIWNSDLLGDSIMPLTTQMLRELATTKGYTGYKVNESVRFNKHVGLAFEKIALQSQFLNKNNKKFVSVARGFVTLGKTKIVIPDAVSSVTVTEFRFLSKNVRTRFENSSFFEVKAFEGSIKLSTNNFQILGELDVASKSPAGTDSKPRATLTFITTSNTVIGFDVIQRAQELNIHLYQIKAFTETDDNSIFFGDKVKLAPGIEPRNITLQIPSLPLRFQLPSRLKSIPDSDEP
jgi:hypothetical protein